MKENISANKSLDFAIKIIGPYKSDYIKESVYYECNNDCLEIVKLLASIVKTTKANLGR